MGSVRQLHEPAEAHEREAEESRGNERERHAPEGARRIGEGQLLADAGENDERKPEADCGPKRFFTALDVPRRKIKADHRHNAGLHCT